MQQFAYSSNILYIRGLCNCRISVATGVCVLSGLLAASVDVVQPFVLGCDTKNAKIVQLSLVAVQRLISQQLLNKVSFSFSLH